LPLPLPAAAVFFAAFVAFVVVFDDFATFAMVDCLSSNEVEVPGFESNDNGAITNNGSAYVDTSYVIHRSK